MGGREEVRRVGKVGKRRAAALRKLKPFLLARSGNRCEISWCRRRAKLDPHHIVPRSKGGGESLANIIMLDRRCHEAVDLPAGRGRLEIQVLPFAGVVFFQRGNLVGMHPLTPPEEKG